jgi:rhamnulokinase
MKKPGFLAFDLGAESGRAVLGTLHNKTLQLQEIHRFSNGYKAIRGRLYWNVFNLFNELKIALGKAALQPDVSIESIAVDTWGVDFGLLGKDGSLLSMPFAYRDTQTDGMTADFATHVMPLDKLYLETGIQTMQINTLFQLYALKKQASSLLETATNLLFMPDLINYFFTGSQKTEHTIASTSQLLDPYTKNWNETLFRAIGIPVSLMQPIVTQGYFHGEVDMKLCRQLGIAYSLPVVSVASHDTGSAVAAIPADDDQWAFLSSGTWSLMGLELNQPFINDASATKNYTNEGGVNGTYRFQKNSAGLWLLQECRRNWEKDGHSYTYEQLVAMAELAQPFRSWIDPDDHAFLNPPDMPEAIRSYCQQTRQPVPETKAEITRCIFDSLAMKYRLIMNELKQFNLKQINRLHVIGGGTKNKLLCQLTANALGMPVLTGPSEATATGNILVQAKTLGHLSSLSESRSVVKTAFSCQTYTPSLSEDWDKLEAIVLDLLTRNPSK